MSRRGRLGFVAACLAVFGLIAAFITWGPTAPRPLSSGATVIGDSDRLATSAASLLR